MTRTLKKIAGKKKTEQKTYKQKLEQLIELQAKQLKAREIRLIKAEIEAKVANEHIELLRGLLMKEYAKTNEANEKSRASLCQKLCNFGRS